MENSKKAIVKLFTVIAVAVAILLCGVLFGCGNKQVSEREIGDGECATLPPTGFYMKAEIEEKEEYDIDDISISILYGMDIDLYNSVRESASCGVFDDNTEIRGIYITAYDRDAYWRLQFPHIDYERLYEDFSALEVGSANNGAFLIEEIPYTIDRHISKFEPNEMYQYVAIDILKGTDYECSVSYNKSYQITCYKKINVKLPRELFTSDSGRIMIDLSVLAYNNDSLFAIFEELEVTPIRFDYIVEGNKVAISNIYLGTDSVVEATSTDSDEK